MTEVYVTRSGAKYHATYHCPSLDDAEQNLGHAIHRQAVPLSECDRQPCSVCWPLTVGYDSWKRFEHRVEQEGDSPYEARFVQNVLREIPGLRPDDVLLQQQVRGQSGKPYFIDFVLRPSGGFQLAIEVDGVDKAPGLKTPDRIQMEVETRRADLIAAGWRMLNFSNTRVSTRPEECITEIRAALQVVARARGSAGQDSAGMRGSRVVTWSVGAVGIAAVVTIGAYFLMQSTAVDGPNGPVAPNGQDCPSAAPIKGNVADSGERIFHEPGWRYYDTTWPEDCFATEADAMASDYRKSEIE